MLHGTPAVRSDATKHAIGRYPRDKFVMDNIENPNAKTNEATATINPTFPIILGWVRSGSPGPLIAISRIMGSVFDQVNGIVTADITNKIMVMITNRMGYFWRTLERIHGGMEARIQFDGLSPLDGAACSHSGFPINADELSNLRLYSLSRPASGLQCVMKPSLERPNPGVKNG